MSLVLEFFVHREQHFPQESFFGFYALLGFAACLACLLIARGLSFFLKAPTDYYDNEHDA